MAEHDGRDASLDGDAGQATARMGGHGQLRPGAARATSAAVQSAGGGEPVLHSMWFCAARDGRILSRLRAAVGKTGRGMTTRLRVLCALANPTDLPRYDDAALWQILQSAASDAVLIERLAKPTENALRQRLTEGEWDVLHIAAHAQARGEAHYASVSLEASDGRARSLTGSYLAEFLKP